MPQAEEGAAGGQGEAVHLQTKVGSSPHPCTHPGLAAHKADREVAHQMISLG